MRPPAEESNSLPFNAKNDGNGQESTESTILQKNAHQSAGNVATDVMVGFCLSNRLQTSQSWKALILSAVDYRKIT